MRFIHSLSTVFISLIAVLGLASCQANAGAPLQYLVRQPSIGADHPPVIIMMHGYGSNESDLFDLANAFPSEYLVISARGPITLGQDSYAWYHLEFSNGTRIINEQEEAESRVKMTSFVDYIAKLYQVDTKRIYLMGFSQGAIMSYSMALSSPTKYKGIIPLSGRVLDTIKPTIKPSEALSKLRVFIGHGTQDNVITLNFAQDAKTYLQSLGVQVEYHEYPMAHSISQSEMGDMLQWLKQ
jgi:phospholipase/carboxylesterase